MRLEAKKYLYDIQHAAELIHQFTVCKNFNNYQNDPVLRLAVERAFSIIGEALSQLAKARRSACNADQRISTHHLFSQYPCPFLCRGRRPARMGPDRNKLPALLKQTENLLRNTDESPE
jgi:hypothetical protein